MATHPASADASGVELGFAEEVGGTFFTEEELANANRSPNKVVTTRPSSLGYVSIILIIVNRMVGTSILDMVSNWDKADLY